HLLLWADPSGSLRFLNRHYTTLTGHDRTLAIAEQSWRDRVHADDRATLAAAFTRKAAPGAELHCEFRLLHHDGAFRWMLL
ncbi:PAS domain-containing protein, partial [Acinetobacter baumannii]